MGARVLRLDSDTSDSEAGLDEKVGKGKSPPCCKGSLQVVSTTTTTLLPTALDSYRGDLLAALPFEGGPNAFNSIDEFIQIQRREDLVLKVAPDVAHPVVSVVFPLSIQDPCVYRCFLVGAQSLYEFRRSTGRPRPSSLVIDLYGKAIAALQSRLSEKSAYLDDNVLFSIVHLMIASAGQHDLPAVKQHLGGIRQIITLRGGLGKTPAHLSIRGLLIVVEYFMALEQYLDFSCDDVKSIPSSRLHYARHPFSPQLCQHIATLPDGFAEVALSGRISVQCIQLLCSVAAWQPLVDEQHTTTLNRTQDTMCRLFSEPRECARDAALLLLYLKRSRTPPGLEYVIGIGMAICVRHLSGENRTSVFDTMLLRRMLDHIRAIPSPQPSDSDALIWLALVVNWRTQSFQPVQEADDVLDHVVARFPAASRTWHAVEKICRRFWWFDCLKLDLLRCWKGSLERTASPAFKQSHA